MITLGQSEVTHECLTFVGGCSLAVVEDGELPKQSPSRHHAEELALPGYLHLALLHHVHDAPDVALLDDQRALGVLHGVHTVHNFLKQRDKHQSAQAAPAGMKSSVFLSVTEVCQDPDLEDE